MMIGRAEIEQLGPQIIGLGHLARSRMSGVRNLVQRRIRRLVATEHAGVLPDARYKPAARDRRQKRFEFPFIAELPTITPELTNDLDPHRLNDIARIEFGAHRL